MPTPPKAPKTPHRISRHQRELSDDYFWMRDRRDPRVREYLEKENEYTAAVMRDTEGLQKTLYDEFISRIQETDLSVPVKQGSYLYYSRTEKGLQYAVHCRKKAPDGPEEVMLDGNALAKGHAYFRLGSLRVSPDHGLLAYAVDTEGSERYSLFVKDLSTGFVLEDPIGGCYPSFEWDVSGRILFYAVLDEARRPHKIFRHKLGLTSAMDDLVFHEPDEAFFVSVGKTKDRKYLLLGVHSQTTSEVRVLEADRPLAGFRTFAARRSGVEYSVEHHGDRFFVLTNSGARNFRLMEAREGEPEALWKERIRGREEATLEGIDVFRGHLIVYERETGLVKIRVDDLATGGSHHIAFDEAVYTAWPAGNPEFDAGTLRFGYTSMVTPSSIYDYDLRAKTRELKKRTVVHGGYDPKDYESERVFAVSHDGARVPISLVYRKGMRKDGRAPLVLYGYGSYGISLDAEFSSSRLSLLDRGFVYAVAHVRGGADLGRGWYEDGKFLKKKNTFIDFIACAEHLIEHRYTSKGKIAIYGGSAGGMLVGAAANLRPDLFGAAVAMVPFVDVINTMLDRSLPLTVIEFEEWGNPEKKEFFDYMLSYSPYDNVRPQKYPAMLITGGLNDPRVQYWEPAKWTAKLREANQSDKPILLHMDMTSGHGGPSGRYDSYKELAFDYAFILKALGLTPSDK